MPPEKKIKKYGVEVYGVDLATNSICLAWERAQSHPNLKVRFEIADITKHEFPPQYFDVIYSRDTILHLVNIESAFSIFRLRVFGKEIDDFFLFKADKKALFAKFKVRGVIQLRLGYNPNSHEFKYFSFQTWLRPGGKVFITDYVCGPKPWCNDFAAYVEQRGYNLLTVEEYGNIFKDLGFVNVKPEDKTDLFVYYLKRELDLFEKNRESFIKVYKRSS